MRALSYRQPWAWAMLHAGKNIENRHWRRKLEGRVLIHAAKGCTSREYTIALAFMHAAGVDLSRVPQLRGLGAGGLDRGGIVGVLTFTGEVLPPNDDRPERWHMPEQYGYFVRDAKPLPFLPWKGALGVFDVPDDALAAAYGPLWLDLVGVTS